MAIQFANGRVLPNVPIELFNSGAFTMPDRCIHSDGHPTKDRLNKGKVTSVDETYSLEDGQNLEIKVSKETPLKESHKKLRDSILYMAGTAQKDGQTAYVIGYEGRQKLTIIFPGLNDLVRTNVNKTKFLKGQFGHRKGTVIQLTIFIKKKTKKLFLASFSFLLFSTNWLLLFVVICSLG